MTPEERLQYRKEWEEKSETRRILIEKICAHHNSHGCAKKNASCEEYEKLLQDFRDTDPAYCKHERSKYSDCKACDDEHMEAFPEYFGRCQSCNSLVDLDELDKDKNCFDCQVFDID